MSPVTDAHGHHKRGRHGGLLWLDRGQVIELRGLPGRDAGDGAERDEDLAQKVNVDRARSVKPKRNQKRQKKDNR